MLIDRATIMVRSGKGGDGFVHFARFKYIPKGGPDGGDGGDGGSVFLLCDPNVATLLDFAHQYHWAAQDGEKGQEKQMAGRDGLDLEIRVPPGTLIYEDTTGELLADLDTPGKRLCVAKGGKRGFGNDHFKNSINQAPHFCEPGQPGEEHKLRLELKLIAEVGLVGKPNAGKSTLLSAISRARPKIADYPFTTLEPQLGITELPGARRMVVADIPGLIEGASQGAGLGHQFLRHVERTRVLIHLVEVEPTDDSDPVANYHIIRNELATYAPKLAQKPQLIALTKMDLLATDADRAAAKELLEQQLGLPVFPISAATGFGLPALLETVWDLVQQEKAQPEADAELKQL